MEPSLADIAVELYAAPPADFVSERNAHAAQAADPAVAAQIRALKKPSTAAWVVNVFAQKRAEQLSEALQLAEELREAQADLDAKALSQLGRDRRALTSRLAAGAVELAQALGARVTSSTRDAVEQTITAAFFDPAAAAAVASGRLIRELEPSGDFADIADSLVGGGQPSTPKTTTTPPDEVKARRERRDAERALREAETAHERAVREAASADRALRGASLRVEELDRRERDLQAELAAVRSEAKRAHADVERAESEQGGLATRVSETEDDLRTAQKTLDGLARR